MKKKKGNKEKDRTGNLRKVEERKKWKKTNDQKEEKRKN